MTRRASETMGGTLRPNDPRRFLVEAMLCAMAADGQVDDSELAVLHRHLDQHDLFAALSERNQQVLLEVARDALKFAGNALARIPAIATGLPWRMHRVTAVTMACEVVVADGNVDDTELAFLERLRLALRIAPNEFSEIFTAAREHRATRDLDARMQRLRDLVPSVVEVFALRSLTLRKIYHEHRLQVLDLLVALPDMAMRDQELETLVENTYKRMHIDLDVEGALVKIAQKVRDPIDRYWTVVYVMCAENPATLPHWRANPFITMLQRVFELKEPYLDLAATDAAAFPLHVTRPT